MPYEGVYLQMELEIIFALSNFIVTVGRLQNLDLLTRGMKYICNM